MSDNLALDTLTPDMKVLVIGAGAVGQVYGYHLARGGADVCFYIKEKYAAEMDKGFDLYQHSLFGKVLKGRTRRHHFKRFSYISDTASLRRQSYDYVLNTVAPWPIGGPCPLEA